jgi:hypothetical protein
MPTRPSRCETDCHYDGEAQCGKKVCIDFSPIFFKCIETIYLGSPCTKTVLPPEASANNQCYKGSYCDKNGNCALKFKPAGTACDLTPAQLVAGGYTQPGCVPEGVCTSVSGGAYGNTLCTAVLGTNVSRVTSFTLVDSEAPITTYELATFSRTYTLDHREIHNCNYNIRVNVQDCQFKVDSVLIEWDLDVPRKGLNYGNISFCEEYTPYAVFGDPQRGTPKDLGPYTPLFNDATLFLGTHKLKATPYSGSLCNGTAGTPLNATVKVVADGKADCPGTVANVEIINATSKKAVDSLEPYHKYCLPSNYTFRACVAACRDGEIKWVYFQLYRLDFVNFCDVWTPVGLPYNDTTKPNFYFHESADGAVIGGSNYPLANGFYKLIVTPYGNIWNNSYTPPKVISSYGKGDKYTIPFFVYCNPY